MKSQQTILWGRQIHDLPFLLKYLCTFDAKSLKEDAQDSKAASTDELAKGDVFFPMPTKQALTLEQCCVEADFFEGILVDDIVVDTEKCNKDSNDLRVMVNSKNKKA